MLPGLGCGVSTRLCTALVLLLWLGLEVKLLPTLSRTWE